MSTAQRRSATRSRPKARKTQQAVNTEAAVEQPRPGASTSRPPKPEPIKDVDPAKPRRGFSLRLERIRKLIQDTWSEIKKISWPDGDTVRRLTALVLVMAIVLGLLLGGIDFLLLKVFDALT
ncbi:MAG: preprotein translocase subunit SecE [Thermomicrobiales bacterium]|nr:preprotein translocase subunit SecE [Thermomicrobiales bacterium]